ncbi:general secretion pathway protein GspB [Kaarinaea lacus]
MSYILDALKKSEQERQRGNVPDIKSIHNTPATPATQTRRSWWLYLFILVLLVNGAIFSVVYLGDNTGTETLPGTQESELAALTNESTTETSAARTGSAVKDVVEARPAETPEPFSQAPAPQAQPASPSQPQTEAQPKVIFSKEPLDMSTDSINLEAALANNKAPTKEEQLSENQVTEEEEPALLIAELPESVRQKIPNIEFAGHVYSNSVERRSVMINGKKMREGEVVGSGLILQAITPEGAEFEFEGYRFKLNALQDWSSR